MTEEVSFCKKTIGADPEVLAYRVLLRTMEIPEKTKGGLLLTQSSKDEISKRNNIGQVLKIGPYAFSEHQEIFRVNIGDWVHYNTMEREPVICNGILCYYVNDSRMMAVVSPEDLPAFIPFLKDNSSKIRD